MICKIIYMSTAKKSASPKKKASSKKAAHKSSKENDDTYKEFKQLVNMNASSLEKWLQTKESKNTGWDSGDGEAIGHKSGKTIAKLLRKKKTEFTQHDYHEMGRVISYISRHKAQKPAGDVSETKWNYSLKNWGYDYTKHK